MRATQSVATFGAYTGIRSEQVRNNYVKKVSTLSPTDANGRTAAKVQARSNTPTITKTMAENMRPIAKEGTRVGGTANKSNAGVNKLAGKLGAGGKLLGVAGAGLSVYNVATADDKSQAVAKEGGAMAGAIIGGIVGSIGGGIIGSFVGEETHDAVEQVIDNSLEEGKTGVEF